MHSKSLLSATLLVAQAMFTAACSGSRPAIKDDNTVTIRYFSGSEAVITTTSIGVLGVCHVIGSPAHSFFQAVGQNLFGRNLHINTFSSSDCSGGAENWPLTNNVTCFVNGGNDWNSFSVA